MTDFILVELVETIDIECLVVNCCFDVYYVILHVLICGLNKVC